MQTHRMRVIIPEDHRLILDLPEKMRSGPAEVIVKIAAEPRRALKSSPDRAALARWDAAVSALDEDPRAFQQLSPEERRARIRHLRGAGKGLLSPSEEFARRKRDEIELEERKLAR